MIQIFVPLTVHPKRRHIFPLLKPFEKGEGYNDTTRMEQYGISEKDIKFVDTIEIADYVVLPMSWNFYSSEKRLTEAQKAVEGAAMRGKKVLSFMTGDFGVNIKEYPNLVVFRHSGERAKLSANHKGYPAFIKDPLQAQFNTDQITVRPYTPQPVVGFCGQANASLFNAAKEYFRTLGRNVQSKSGFSRAPSQQLLSTSYLRASVLKTLEEAQGVTSNFIYRNKYRAGAANDLERKKTTQEFYENLQQSDYVVCVRGAGNFSVRFYEALAMGRIPIFIDTDCVLPLAEEIDWKQHVVWVPYGERDRVAEKVLDFHNYLSAAQFEALQLQNRKLWLDTLRIGGFFKTVLGE
ncbi:exostosin domain-containing protein [Marinirhabdus gelatinilytica]|uniref:Exostosin family protein n=1 Tax=Marinirhabdus gelatinilytica TaxID=1703343 RepID=A0A370Q8X5_9FLAO|nr:exostosin family protein [Marinirhabdus gelatinilytica]RDK84822.1 exostosin family protein [Marinirhabdus gelatinilytica]